MTYQKYRLGRTPQHFLKNSSFSPFSFKLIEVNKWKIDGKAVFLDKFLDASTHLYKRLCPSVRGSVGPSRVSQISRKWRPEDYETSGNSQILLNLRKFMKILSFSHLLDASLFGSNLFFCRLLHSRNNVSTFQMIICRFHSKSAIQKKTAGRTDGRMDGPRTDGPRTDPHIEMRGRI